MTATGAAAARGGRLLRGSLFGLVLKAAGVLLAFAGQVVAARLLGVEGFGVYATVIAWTTVLSLLGGFGMPLCAVRFLAVYAERGDWPAWRGFLHAAWWLSLGSSVAIAAVAVAAFAAVPALRPMLGAMMAGAPIAVLLCLTALAVGVFLARQMPVRAEGLGNVSRQALVLLLLGLAVLFGVRLDAERVLGLTVLACVLALGMQGMGLMPLLAGRLGGPRDFAERPHWLASGGTFLVSTVAYALVERVDTILVSALLSPAEAGPYAAASRLALLVGVALAPVNAMLGPMGAQLLARGDREGLQRLMGQGVLISSALAIGLAVGLLIGAPLLLGLFGSGFAAGVPVLATLVASQVAIAVAGPAGGLLAIAGHNRILIGAMLGTALLDLVLCAALIPRLGTLGAALSTTLALAANGMVLAVAARRRLHVDTTLAGGILLLARTGGRGR